MLITILGDHELRSRAMEDPPHHVYQLSIVHDQFTQTGDGDTDSEVAHRSGKLESITRSMHTLCMHDSHSRTTNLTVATLA